MPFVSVQIEGNIATLTLATDQPENRLTVAAEADLAGAVTALREEPAIRILILRGGDDFCGGLDPATWPEADNPLETWPARSTSRAVDALAAFDRPAIAAIDGLAAGSGLELALACDLRVAGPTARLAFPETGWGTIPSGGGTQRLPRIVGKARAFDLIALGRTIDATEAAAIGLADRPGEDRSALEEAYHLAGVLLTRGPLALRFVKEAIARGQDLTLDQGLRLEADLAIILMTTADRKEGIQSFKEKRPPVYRGE